MKSNFLIIGSGVAGLNLALKLSQKGTVILATKSHLKESNSSYAQGGIASVSTKQNPADSFQKHIDDTMVAGHHHNNLEAVKILVENGPTIINELKNLGVNFSNELGREGGHSENRIHHVGDYTGQAITEAFIKKVEEDKNITILENCFAHDIIIKNQNCFGAIFIYQEKQLNIFAGSTVLATGGIGQIFTKTTNPKIATGDGIAMAIRSHIELEDLQYIQFHPTALDNGDSPLFLISEAVRGEGAKLINNQEEYFMEKAHHLKDLAPRDIVSEEIYKQHAKGNKVFLDCRKFSKSFLEKRFPKIYQKLKTKKITMESDLIPVTPAAHYSCGGIKVNLKGETNIKNLYACGEVACTKVHGTNRLASNSLLEALVFGNLLAKNTTARQAQETKLTNNTKTPQSLQEEDNKKLIKETLNH